MKNYRTSSNKSQQTINTSCPPQWILRTKDAPTTPAPTKTLIPFTLTIYAQTLGKTKEELLQTLKCCYEKPTEEVPVATTFELDEEGF